MREIILTKGYVAQVDDEDYEELNRYNWRALIGTTGVVYAVHGTSIRFGDRKFGETQKLVYMHQKILGAIRVDHKDGNGLNNQRYNLRSCTQQQNCGNTKLSKRNSSGFKGVTEKTKGRWSAQIEVDRKQLHLGMFSSKEEAALVYQEAAEKYFGEFVRKQVANF